MLVNVCNFFRQSLVPYVLQDSIGHQASRWVYVALLGMPAAFVFLVTPAVEKNIDNAYFLLNGCALGYISFAIVLAITHGVRTWDVAMSFNKASPFMQWQWSRACALFDCSVCG